jgi:hypothetical protein
MSTAKKFELAPDEVYIQEALKDGRATVMEVSMKALGTPDVAFQARVKHLDMEHVMRLDLIYKQEERLAPAVVFRPDDPADPRMILADGFHRHEVYRKAGASAIRAYLITVPADRLEHEARMFAAMCNQQLSLGRTPQDIQKAIEILLANPECREWADARIGKHCGVSAQMVSNCRTRFNVANNIKEPEFIVDSAGRRTPYRKPHSKCSPRIRVGSVSYTLKGKWVGTEDKAKVAVSELESNRSRLRSSLSDFFSVRGFHFVSVMYSIATSKLPGLRGYHGHGVIYTYARFDESDTAAWAYGCLHGLRKLADQPNARLVCLCVPEDAPATVLDLYRKLGIEFLTPDELVESLKGEKDNLPGQPVITTSHTDGTTMINIT